MMYFLFYCFQRSQYQAKLVLLFLSEVSKYSNILLLFPRLWLCLIYTWSNFQYTKVEVQIPFYYQIVSISSSPA